jgi:NADPH:quinone reductase-like Zn-dependent oxidoreductase
MEDQMRAWVYTKPGRPENILSLANVPKPKLTSPNQVLVKVSHASLFSSNVAIMALVPNPAGTPRIPEMEFAGTVAALGENVRADLKQSGPGTQVWGLTLPMENKLEVINHIRKPNGTLTEYIVAHQDLVVIKPPNIDPQEVAGMAGMGCTAVEFLDAADLKEGDYVLINGGSGAVGILLLQIAKEIVGPSGKVVTTCSGEKFDLVKQYGADMAIDYRAQDPVHEYLMREYSTRKFDAIIDTASSQELYDHSPAYLNSGKLFLDMAVKHPVDRDWRATDLLWFMCNQVKNNFQPRWLGGTQTKYKFISATPTLKSLERLRKLIAEGKLRGPVDSVWSMDQAIPVGYQMACWRCEEVIMW